MTPAQRELARHALGLPNRNKRSYRNRYFAAAGGPTAQQWEAMSAAGDAEQVEPSASARSVQFALTPAGAKAALERGESLCPEDFPS